MDQLSVELIHCICDFLLPEDLRAIRLVCKGFEAIGAAHLLPELHIIRHPEFEKHALEVIKHPIFSRHVKSLYYEADILDRPLSFKKWEIASDTTWTTLFPPKHPWTHRPRDGFRTTNPGSQLSTSLSGLDQQERRRRFEAYQYTANWTYHTLASNNDLTLLSQTIRNLPELKRLYISTANGLGGRSFRLFHSFRDCCSIPFGAHHEHPEAVRELEAAISALTEVDSKLEKLHVGRLAWTFFRDPGTPMLASLNLICKTLRSLRLEILTGFGAERESTNDFDLSFECRKFLTNGAMRRLLDGIDDLQSLDLAFVGDARVEEAAADFSLLISTSKTWPNLKKLCLSNVAIEQEPFLEFIKRHSSKLRRLRFMQYMVVKAGGWIGLFQSIKAMTKLDDAFIVGHLEADGRREIQGGTEVWVEPWLVKLASLTEPDPMRDALAKYLVDGEGVCPLKIPDTIYVGQIWASHGPGIIAPKQRSNSRVWLW